MLWARSTGLLVLVVRRRSSRLAGGLRRSGPRCMSGIQRTELGDVRPKSLRERLAEGQASDM